MRTQLAGGLIRSAVVNCNRKTGCGRFFEVGNIHIDNRDLPEERKHIGIIHFGAEESFFTLKATVEELLQRMGLQNIRFEKGGSPYLHPTQKAFIKADGQLIGDMGTLHPAVGRAFELPCDCYIAELDFGEIVKRIVRVKKYKPLPKYPVVARDIALIVDNSIEAQQVIDAIQAAKARVLIDDVKLFDVYRPLVAGDKGIPEGKKSMAFSYTLHSDDRTLTDEDITQAFNAILKSVKFRVDGDLRT